MRITWGIEGGGAGEAEAVDVEAALEPLCAAVRDAYGHLGVNDLATALPSVLGPLRASVVTDGRYAIERGDTWSTRVGGIFVTLYP